MGADSLTGLLSYLGGGSNFREQSLYDSSDFKTDLKSSSEAQQYLDAAKKDLLNLALALRNSMEKPSLSKFD
jgi:hypothetical protein